MKGIRWLCLVAGLTALSAIGVPEGWAAEWRVAEQPELKRALETAPLLQTESLGEPARGVNVWERWLVPNPDGKSWDLLQIYFKEYYGPTWLFAVDLGSGDVKKQRLPDGHQFYLSGRALGFDGKFYIATPSRRTWNMHLFVYDPATNTLEERGEIVQGLGGEVRPLAVGPDGRIYGTGTRGNQVGLYIYDPKSGKVVKDFGAVGPRHPNGAWSRYVMGVDDTHAYIASGMIPAWYLVAINLENGDQKVLLESPTERVMDIIESFPSAYVRVPQDDRANKEYWLYHGEAIPKVNDQPPWLKKDSPWAKAVPKPDIYFDQIDPDEHGNAMVWYRSREKPPGTSEIRSPKSEIEAGWKSIRLEGVNTYPHRINPLSVLPDGRLYGTGDDYVGTFLFNPRTDETIYCGPRVGLAPYATIVCEGKLYLSGYSGGHLFVYDPARPWTLGKGGPPGSRAPDQGDARSNPRYLGDFDRKTRVGLMHSAALGADGKVYFGGFGLRHYTGGGFGWFDPKAGKLDGFWKPLSGYAVHFMAPAFDGKSIVISTTKAADELNNNQAPEEAKLFVYDVTDQKIVREIVPAPKSRATGLIAEVAPGRFLGLTTTGAAYGKPGSGLLYGVDVATGEVLFRRPLPWPVSMDSHWPHWVDPSYEYLGLVRGPDGFLWTWLKNVLVRIDPKDASVHVVGKIDPVGHPTFVGNDMYLSGPEQLRRIRNIARPP
jgi:outer membrane protein assembly factor BamB